MLNFVLKMKPEKIECVFPPFYNKTSYFNLF